MQLKNDFDADKFNLDENAVDAHLQLLSIPWKVICIKVIWIGNGLDIRMWTRLLIQVLSNA